jgi:hypothetical protein
MNKQITIRFELEGSCADLVEKLASTYANGNCNEYAKKQFKAVLCADLEVSEIIEMLGIDQEMARKLREDLSEDKSS